MKQPCLIVTDPPGVSNGTQVGAVTNTFNVPGVVGNCFFLKTAEDAKAIRERVNACFELANLPDSTEEDRKRLLSFVVVCPHWPPRAMCPAQETICMCWETYVSGSLDCERDTDASVRLVFEASFWLRWSYHAVTYTRMYPAGRRRPHWH